MQPLHILSIHPSTADYDCCVPLQFTFCSSSPGAQLDGGGADDNDEATMTSAAVPQKHIVEHNVLQIMGLSGGDCYYDMRNGCPSRALYLHGI